MVIVPVFVTVHSCLVNSNNSQAHLEFCLAKGACELLNHVLTHQNSKCFGAVCTVTGFPLFMIKISEFKAFKSSIIYD